MALQSYVQLRIGALVFSRANDRITFYVRLFSPQSFHQKGEETKRGDILVKQNFQVMPPMIDNALFRCWMIAMMMLMLRFVQPYNVRIYQKHFAAFCRFSVGCEWKEATPPTSPSSGLFVLSLHGPRTQI